jgi:PAS domain S-box-containing protein
MNRLLQRQVNKYLQGIDVEQAQFQNFLKAIDDAYRNYEDQYLHIERALEMSSKELFKKNKALKDYNENLEKEIEERTREVNKLALVARKTQNAIVLTDPDGIAVWANEGFTRITGYSVEELIGKKPGSLLQGPKTNPETRKAIGEAIKNHSHFDGEIYNYGKNGVGYWLSISITPLLDDGGKISGFIAIESDITKSKQQQEAIEPSEAKYRQLVHSLKEVVFQTDARCSWIFLNPAWEEITGYGVKDTIGKRFSDFILEEDFEKANSIFHALMDRKHIR